ncbi:receptor-interacting serine/threonine-protein kinase 3-like isoform X2 [Betta splendens]|uniref:Receptor-interacting serine/threonine-protein kinase 3-like isoform X2 n=1 Tax=Betta splendens TaxID=158456 RepID=A0A9W2XUR0_BETSP|nr:receptor-interacting serine/threonine-protein kinase 3-like isoform X2 [Betta splendens]
MVLDVRSRFAWSQQEMARQSRVTVCVGAESLEEPWERVGSGGFGCVYKARHKEWRIDVAIKLLDCDFGLWEEANNLDLASCEFVLRVYGLFQGRPPIRGIPEKQGIVMEFMRRGSVESLQKDLRGPPPWPLAFRLAHEVALGLNFLHSKNLVHSDLKPSNVLLNDDFHAKLADFGLSRVSASVLNNNGESTGQSGGTFKYMPPEAFELSYNFVRSFDIYRYCKYSDSCWKEGIKFNNINSRCVLISYGIFLWSVLTGKEPYEVAHNYSHVALRINDGDRPPLTAIDQSGPNDLGKLAELMTKCWVKEPTQRPSFRECLNVTEDVFLMHESGIPDAISDVLTRLKTPGVSPLTSEEPSSNNTVYLLTPENSETKQNLVRRMSDADKAKFVDGKMAELVQRVPEVTAIVDQLGTMVHSETYSVIESKATSQDKMRTLYRRTLHSGGVKVKAAFYDILIKDYPDLVTSLGGEL